MNEFKPVHKYLEKIDSWISIVIISVFAAFGVNLLVCGIAVLLNNQHAIIMIFFSLLFIVIPTLILLFWPIRKQKRNVSIRGFFLYSKKDRSILCIPEYYISLVMSNHINAALGICMYAMKHDNIRIVYPFSNHYELGRSHHVYKSYIYIRSNK